MTGVSFRVLLTRAAFTVVFFFCVYPFSVNGLGANYSFLILPLSLALLRGRLRHPGDMLMLAIAFYTLVFFVASLYQFEFATDSVRRFTSFAIFMSMFAYAFITVDDDKVAGFKTAVVAISVYLSLVSAYTLLDAESGRNVGFEAKDLVGSQRFGFVYLLAIWLAYLDRSQKALLGFARYPVLIVLMAGLLLTFSRSSIVAMLTTSAVFIVVRQGKWLRKFSVRSVLRAAATVVGAAVLIGVLFWVFPLAFDFFNVRLFGFFSNSQQVLDALDDSSSSEGTRVMIASHVLEYVVRNPLTGSGFLGVWVLTDLPAGSAHSQYFDVLFRTGFLGFILYVYILFGVMRYLWKEQEALFWGAFSVLVYGLFHETFKESQGAFLLAFLVGMTAQYRRGRWRAPAARADRANARVTGRSNPTIATRT
jgi:O-antigen ligase